MMAIESVIPLVSAFLFVRHSYCEQGPARLRGRLRSSMCRDWIAYLLILTTLSQVLRALLCLLCVTAFRNNPGSNQKS